MADVEGLPATFTTARAREAGVQYRDLYRARDVGKVIELSRGVFRQANAPAAAYPDLLGISYRAPNAVVCLLSAALIHDLTDESPVAIQIAVPRRAWRPVIDYPPVEVFTWDAVTFDVGLASIEAAPGESVRIYSPARTVADLMRLRSRIGSSMANIALRRYLSRGGSPVELMMIAERLDVLGPVRTAVDILQAS